MPGETLKDIYLQSGLNNFTQRLNVLGSQEVQNGLLQRSRFCSEMRRFATEQGLIEIDLPMLERPWGEYNKQNKDQFWVVFPRDPRYGYVLRQSPQILKQAFSYATQMSHYRLCENFRGADCDRTHAVAFYQFDVELANADGTKARRVCENIISGAINSVFREDLESFNERDYRDVVALYGHDNPDLHHGLELDQLGDGSPVIHVKPKTAEKIRELGNVEPSKDCNYTVRPLNSDDKLKIKNPQEIGEGDELVVFTGIPVETVREKRQKLIKLGLSESEVDQLKVYWLINMPYGERKNGKVGSCHHVVSRPLGDTNWETADLPEVPCDSYDLLLCNNTDTIEIAGGDARINSYEQQLRALKALGYDDKTIEESFSFLLEALKYNDNHDQIKTAGFAFGIERIMMVLTRADSFNTVYSFPQNTPELLFSHTAPMPLTNMISSRNNS